MPAAGKTGVNELKYQQLTEVAPSVPGIHESGCQSGESGGLTPCWFQKASQYLLKTNVTFDFILLSKNIIWTYLQGDERELYTFTCVLLF